MSQFVELTPDLLAGFLDEAPTYLATIEEALLAFERQARGGTVALRCTADHERMDDLFRAAHSLKGVSASLGFQRIRDVTHVMESFFDQFRSGACELDSAGVETLLSAIDCLRVLLDECGGPGAAPVAIDGVLAALRRLSDQPRATRSQRAPSSPHVAPGSAATHAASDAESRMIPSATDDGALLELRVGFAADVADAPILACMLYNRLADLGHVVRTEPDVERLEHDSAAREFGYWVRTRVEPDAFERVVADLGVSSFGLRAGGSGAAARLGASGAAEGGVSGQMAASVATLRVDVVQLDDLTRQGVELSVVGNRIAALAGRLGSGLSCEHAASLAHGLAERLRQLRGRVRGGARRPRKGVALELARLAEEFELLCGALRPLRESRQAMDNLAESIFDLNRIAGGMRRGLLHARLVTIRPLFQRFQRVVRDLGRSVGKPVELVLEGENTTLDKRLVDELADPLTHIIRNAVDHGIESPERRAAAGKPRGGRIALRAFHRGGHTCIEVRDDGGGIDLAAVRRTIVERGLADAATVARMSDREAMQYLFRPGFSTAPNVTELSGRGVGMDVVRTRIGELKGAVALDSRAGAGTTISIQLPLTLSLARVLPFRSGATVYAVPLANTVEVLAGARRSRRGGGAPGVIRTADGAVPLVALEELFGLSCRAPSRGARRAATSAVLALRVDDRRVGLIVDELLEPQEIVVQELGAACGAIRSVSGAAILNDGGVAVILDVAALLERVAAGARS